MLKQIKSREDWNEKSVGAKGFTLIELLVVIIILGVLAAVAIFAVGNIGGTSKKNACKTEKDTLLTAIEGFHAQTTDDSYGVSVDSLRGVANTKTDDAGNVIKTLKSDTKYWMVNSGATPANSDVITKTGVTLPTGCT